MEGFTIRKAVNADLKFMLDIQSMCYPSALVEAEYIFQSMLDTSLVLLSKNKNEGLIGYLLAHPWHDIKSPPKLHSMLLDSNIATCFFLHDLTINPKYQRQNLGLGTQLVKEIECFSNALPMCLVAVNNTAISYWSRKHGFTPKALSCDANILDSYGDESAIYMVRVMG